MLRCWLPKHIFAVDECSSIGVSAFNHCSSLCPHNNGVLLAWYAGSGECKNDQSVYVTYLSGSKGLTPIRIGNKTGNPILWNENGKTWLLWSKFEDIKPIRNLAHRWRYCSLWIQEVKFNGEIELSQPTRITEATQNLLARTNPIMINKEVVLPLYDEVKRECVLFSGSNGQFEELSRYGRGIIQPAIWVEGKRIHSLGRNFGNRKRYSIHYYSDDCLTWSSNGSSSFRNMNSSIAVHPWNDHHMVLWNNSNTLYRTHMTLGIMDWDAEIPKPFALKVVNARHGSYPCFCVDKDNQLHFAYTNEERKIQHHVWNKKVFKRAYAESKLLEKTKRSRNSARRRTR